MKLYKVVIPAAALIFSGQMFTVSAAEGQDAFAALDADKDGYISAEEGKSHETLTEKWVNTDVNQDGMIDRAEFSALEIKETTMEAPEAK